MYTINVTKQNLNHEIFHSVSLEVTTQGNGKRKFELVIFTSLSVIHSQLNYPLKTMYC